MASLKPQMSKQICATPECDKPITARGFCVACYYRQLRHGKIVKNSQTQRFKHRLSNIDTANKEATCLVCGRVKIYSRNSKQTQWRCTVDSNHRAKLYKRAYRQVKKDMLLTHCEICFSEIDLVWDHNHIVNKFRGTLCRNCNIALGLFKDNPNLLLNAHKYILSH